MLAAALQEAQKKAEEDKRKLSQNNNPPPASTSSSLAAVKEDDDEKKYDTPPSPVGLPPPTFDPRPSVAQHLATSVTVQHNVPTKQVTPPPIKRPRSQSDSVYTRSDWRELLYRKSGLVKPEPKKSAPIPVRKANNNNPTSDNKSDKKIFTPF